MFRFRALEKSFIPAAAVALLCARPAAAEDAPKGETAATAAPATQSSAAGSETPAPAPAPPPASEPASASGGVAAGAGVTGSAELAAPAGEGAAAAGAPSFAHPVETAPGAVRCSTGFAPGDHPEYKDRNCYEGRLESANVYLYGGLELDTGFAKYTYRDDDQYPDETLYDMRGRFVVGPMLHHEFGKSGFYVRATGQLVGWVRDQYKIYQINVDDVYGEVGGPLAGGHWDAKVGRFMTWRVFPKGLGFDLYTLEDNGAAITHDVGTNVVRYGTHTYEANYIYLRNASEAPIADETAGRAALHYFPTRFLGFELTGVYGQANTGLDNSIGGRLAADLHGKLGPVLVRLSGAAEDRFLTPTKHARPYTIDPVTGEHVYHECPDCGVQDFHGLAGGGVVKFSIVEVGGAAGRGWQLSHGNGTTGAPRLRESTIDRMSYGGYLQLDPGTLLVRHPLIVGAGLYQAHMLTRTDYSENHLQGAAYIAFPLGFNDTMLKLVLSRSKLDTWERTSALGAPPEYTHHVYAMTAARLRFAYYF